MKAFEPTIENLLGTTGFVKSGASLPLVYDKNGNPMSVKLVTGYQAAFLANSENGNLARQNDTAVVGIRTIDNKKLGTGINHLVYAVRLLADATTVAATPATEADRNAALLAALWNKIAKAPVYNSEIKFIQGDELFKISGRVLHNTKTATCQEDDFINLPAFILRSNKPFDINIVSAGAVAATDMVMVEYLAIEYGDATL